MKLPRKRVVRVTAILLVIVAIGGVSVADSSQEREQHRVPITIDSRPDFAEVYLNGKFIGSASITPRLTPGEHTIELRRKGYEPWQRQLTVLPGGVSRVVGLLEPKAK